MAAVPSSAARREPGVTVTVCASWSAGSLTPMVDRRRALTGQILEQRAAGRDVQELDAATDRQQRQPARQRRSHEGEFVRVARRIQQQRGCRSTSP